MDQPHTDDFLKALAAEAKSSHHQVVRRVPVEYRIGLEELFKNQDRPNPPELLKLQERLGVHLTYFKCGIIICQNP